MKITVRLAAATGLLWPHFTDLAGKSAGWHATKHLVKNLFHKEILAKGDQHQQAGNFFFLKFSLSRYIKLKKTKKQCHSLNNFSPLYSVGDNQPQARSFYLRFNVSQLLCGRYCF